MPTYDFKCKTCTQTVSITAPIGEATQPKCLKCMTDMTRSYDVGLVKFNGTGYYSTDK
tara:strand:- start:99 stop:272 length:174 start_codon:yes stop_codon:yes gene_type:complete